MARAPRRFPPIALGAGTLTLAALLTACGSGGGDAGPSAAPTTATPTASAGTSGTSPQAPAPMASAAPGTAASSAPAGEGTAATGRCHTSELSASVGRNDPGAGQENFPVVLTNTSNRTCTLAGYPGAAFTDTAGRQLGPDPTRDAGTATVVTLGPGYSAWSALSFANPGVSGATTATPAYLLITPPDERTPLRAPWRGGAVPVSGTASTASLTVLSPGSGT
ncbi:DUF4232 domain-containing protein [Streptomyces sp. S.PB5]|uniref:DUF4232 domain-containing protein n=1 Tax=Streptomyces sp. S.PB5 TaxID=3020844 RepID=UPI0025B03B09|nr:DUF4232 domain-containing protein [Streptomyces sp. S.PB5]MDN3029654.1 DUF4232 domain-containing protein [Streptomyces sp. S.PB5]